MTFRLRFGLEEVDLAEGETTIGRDGTCTISVDDELVSRTHASFKRHDGYIEVTDLGSRNGTRVNGVVIRQTTRLAHGDRIRIGPRELVFYDTERERRRSRDHGDSTTGRLSACATCGEVMPAEAPTCPHCGADAA